MQIELSGCFLEVLIGDQSLRPVQSKRDEEKNITEGEIKLRKNRASGSK